MRPHTYLALATLTSAFDLATVSQEAQLRNQPPPEPLTLNARRQKFYENFSSVDLKGKCRQAFDTLTRKTLGKSITWILTHFHIKNIIFCVIIFTLFSPSRAFIEICISKKAETPED